MGRKIVEVDIMAPAARLNEAGRASLEKQLKKVQKSERKTREGQDPEAVHKLRVALRRLRSELKVMEETVYRPAVTRPLRQKLRRLAAPMGLTRDADVLLQHLERYIATLPPENKQGIEVLRAEVERRRDTSREKMLALLDKPKTKKFFDKLEKLVTSPHEVELKPDGGPDEALPVQVRHLAGSVIWRSYEELLAYEIAPGVNPPSRLPILHRLRVAVKRLRYTLEFFEPALSPPAKELIEQLAGAQDLLGHLHDYMVAYEFLQPLLKNDPGNPALRDYHAFRQAEKQKLLVNFHKCWLALTADSFRKKLTSILFFGNKI